MSITDWLPSGSWLTAALVALVAVAGLALRIAAVGVIPGNRKPSTGMAWLLLILLTPWVGFVAFLFFGSNQVGSRRRERQAEINAAIAEHTRQLPELPVDPHAPPYLRSVVALNNRLGALPLVAGNSVELIPDYAEAIVQMTQAVDSAEHFVDVEFYIAAWDDMTGPFFDALVAATQRGVVVRLLFDHLGSRRIPGYRDMLERLEKTDIDWHPMLPVSLVGRQFRRPDLRNHRKLLVVDGRVGFMGSQNLTEPGYNKAKNHAAGREWVELVLRLHGPVIAELQTVFATDWNAETDEHSEIVVREETAPASAVHGVSCQVVPSGPGFTTENNLRLFTTLIYGATRRISLTSPYFVPDESLLYAVTTAAQRGIDVELFVCEEADQFMVGHAHASYYRALLEAGVRIYLYPAPAVLHSKHFTIDDDVAVVGSSNMDLRSFSLNYEISLMLLGAPVVRRVREIEDAYRAISRELTIEEWAGRSKSQRYLDNVMRLTAALQ